MSILSSTSSGKAKVDAEYVKYGLDPKLVICNSDGTIDYNGSIVMHNGNDRAGRLLNPVLSSLPFKFNVVHGSFDCSMMGLTSLRGAPRVVEGDFDCSNNHLTSLEGGPESVSGRYVAIGCNLRTLHGIASLKQASNDPSKEGSCSIDVSFNFLESLEGAPKTVNGNFLCLNNNIKSLKGCPEHIAGVFDCSWNMLSRIYDKHFPAHYDKIYLEHNKLSEKAKAKVRELNKLDGVPRGLLL